MATNPRTSRRGYRLSGFVDGVWNPEDMIELPGTSWIVVSGMRSINHPGRLFVVDVRQMQASELRWEATAEPARLGPDVFSPHGIASRRLDDGHFELLVVDHGGGEAIDRLSLDLDLRDGAPMVVCGERVVQPPRTSGDAVAYLQGGGFLMTSMFDPTDPEASLKLAHGEKTGQVWRWSPSDGWNRFGELQMSGANGLVVSPDGASVIVCEWAARRVWRLDANGVPLVSVELDFLPDNLRWTPKGHLLLAGQFVPPEAVLDWGAREERHPLAFKVVRVDPTSLEIAPLITADTIDACQMAFGGATGALEIGETFWIGSFSGERIGIFAPG